MIGAIAGALIGAAGSIYSGIQGNSAANQRRLYLDNLEKKLQDSANASKGITAAEQRGYTQMRKMMMEGNNTADSIQSVMGGTRASVAETKQRNNDAMAQLASNMAVNAQQREDAIRAQERENAITIANQRMGIEQEKMQQNAAAGSQIASAGFGMAMADAQSHMDSGKGLFGDGGKSVVGGGNASAGIVNNTYGTDQANAFAQNHQNDLGIGTQWFPWMKRVKIGG